MTIRNVEFDFNPFNAKHADKMSRALTAVQEMQQLAQQADTHDLGAVIRAQCAGFDAFLAELLGEDYDQRLELDTDDLLELKRVSEEVMAQVAAAQQELAEFAQKGIAAPAALPGTAPQAAASAPAAVDFSKMDRAQRRAAIRAIKGGQK